jgi:hypothetical protein
MFLIIALALFVIWIVGFGFFRAVVGGAIHFILLLAVIVLVWHLLSRHSGMQGTGGATSAIGASRTGVAARA